MTGPGIGGAPFGGEGRDGPANPARRRALSRLTVALGAFGAALVGAPVIGFLLAPLLRRVAGTWRDVGGETDFAVGDTVKVTFVDPSPLPWAGVTAATAAWLRRQDARHFTAFSVNCTHLGCPVRWMQGARLFMCPCHGGVYYDDGSPAAGPPLRALYRYPVRVRQGRVEVWTGPLPIAPAPGDAA